MRRWERLGLIPGAHYKKAAVDLRASRRLYSAEQIRLAAIAAEREGLRRRPNGRGGVSDRFRCEIAHALRCPLRPL